MKYVVRTLGFLMLGAILAGCSSGFETSEIEVQAFRLNGLRQVTLNTPFNPPVPNEAEKYNCVTTEFDVPPQGMRLQGSTGGLTYTAFSPTTTALSVGSSLKGNFFTNFSTVPLNTEILIIDDFGAWDKPQYRLPSAIFSSNATSTSLATHIDRNTLTHGAMVMRHAMDAVVGSGLYLFSSQAANGSQTIYQRNNRTLKITAVNTRLQSQELIAGTTKSKITTGSLYLPIKNLLTSNQVVNMSFVIVPCDVYEDFVLSGASTLESYIERLTRVNGGETNLNGVIDTSSEGTFLDLVLESSNLSNDPILKLISEYAKTHIFVAASGNYGLPRAMYPAKWAGVVNVTGSAFENQNVRETELFNAGEVMSVGSLFRLNSPIASGKPVYYFGTSYAAPSVSVFSALDLAGKLRCTDSQIYKSELALDTLSLVDRRLEASTGAVQLRCGSNEPSKLSTVKKQPFTGCFFHFLVMLKIETSFFVYCNRVLLSSIPYYSSRIEKGYSPGLRWYVYHVYSRNQCGGDQTCPEVLKDTICYICKHSSCKVV